MSLQFGKLSHRTQILNISKRLVILNSKQASTKPFSGPAVTVPIQKRQISQNQFHNRINKGAKRQDRIQILDETVQRVRDSPVTLFVRGERKRGATRGGHPIQEKYLESNLEQVRTQAAREEDRQPSNKSFKHHPKLLQDQVKRRPARRDVAFKREVHHTCFAQHRGIHSSAKQSMTSESANPATGAEHKPLVVGLTKPQTDTKANMSSDKAAVALNAEISENVQANTSSAAPSEDNPTAAPNQKPKKEKGPKQPKQPKGGAAAPAPTSPALIDLRVGHILRAIAHPNADSLYVSTIAMGDPEGTEHTQVDEETGQVVRTVCSGLNGLIPLAEMQDRKIVVVANLKPVNMRSIKSAAMVLAASPLPAEGADPHAADRVVELVVPAPGSEAGDRVYFEGWPYGEGKGPEKQLNPKKKQWEAIQPGFFTGDDLVVGFDASKCEEVTGDAQGNLVVEGKGNCTVESLKGATVR